jgi:hypothetical protein
MSTRTIESGIDLPEDRQQRVEMQENVVSEYVKLYGTTWLQQVFSAINTDPRFEGLPQHFRVEMMLQAVRGFTQNLDEGHVHQLVSPPAQDGDLHTK